MPITSDQMLSIYNEVFKGRDPQAEKYKRMTAEESYKSALYKNSPEYRQRERELQDREYEIRRGQLNVSRQNVGARKREIENAEARGRIASRRLDIQEQRYKIIGLNEDRLYELRKSNEKADKLYKAYITKEKEWSYLEDGSQEEKKVLEEMDILANRLYSLATNSPEKLGPPKPEKPVIQELEESLPNPAGI